MPSVAAPRGAGNKKRAPLRDRKNEERFSEEDSEGEISWRGSGGGGGSGGGAGGGAGEGRDMRQLRPYYFLVKKAFVVSTSFVKLEVVPSHPLKTTPSTSTK